MKNNRGKMPTIRMIIEAQKDLALPGHVIDRGDSCWACGIGVDQPVRAHIVGASNGGGLEPSNFFLLCDHCHENQPDGCERWVQEEWIKVQPYWMDRREVAVVVDLLRRIVEKSDFSNDEIERLGRCAAEYRQPPGCGARTSNARATARWGLLQHVMDTAKQMRGVSPSATSDPRPDDSTIRHPD